MLYMRQSQNIVPHLCGCCRGSVTSVFPLLTKVHRSGFSLEFETLFKPICKVVADLWHVKLKKPLLQEQHTVLFSSIVTVKQILQERVLVICV